MALKSFAAIGKLTLEKVSELVKRSDFSEKFPIVVNKKVVDQLNRLVGTEAGRRRVRTAFGNFRNHEVLLKKSVKKYGHPEEILAVGFIESAFQNLPEATHWMRSAGMWQFIPGTARNYNLIVNDKLDERMDIPMATDAAMRYLGALFLRFKDWRLAILSYNAGEGRVQRGIVRTGGRDVWKIIDAGFGGDPGYLAKVMAGAILMRYPSLSY